MNEKLQNLKSKIENDGKTPDGRVSADEWNTLVGAVKTIDKEGYKGPQGEKGEQGEIGPQGPVGPQGPQGNSGYTGAADELEVVNNLWQGGATAALSAEMGKELTNIYLNKNLVGQNNEMVRVKCCLAKGVTYKCYLPIERWDLSGVTLNYNYEYLSIGYFVGDEFTAIRTFLSNYDDYKAEFTFEAPIYGDYQLSIRATEGINVPIAVMPITINYDDPATRLFKGKNNEMIRANYHFAKGLTYQCYLPIERWDLSGVTMDYNYGYFELGYFNETNEFIAIKTLVRDSVKHEASFTFEAPVTGKYQLSIRATEGVDVPISIAPTDAGENEPNKILSGKGNTLVKSRFQLIKGISYACYLQGEQWDLSGVTLDYNYVYFELGYFNEDDVWVEITAYRSDFNNYKPTFTFEAPTTGAYQVSIRATEGTDVPIVIMPTSEAQVDVFAEQLSKAKNLGFTATYSQVEGYIPTLTFMHISDTHCTNVSYTAPFRRTIDICNTLSAGAINKGRNVKFLLHTGDVRNAQYSDGYEFFADVTASLKPNIYVTAGNHDVGNSWEVAQCGTDEQIYAEMIEPMLASWNLKSDGSGTPHPEGKNYYFTDFTDEKVRLIVLYEYETDFELSVDDPTILRGERGIRSFRQTQIDWLINSLQTTPAGYGVVIAKHQPEATNGYFDNPFHSSIAPESVKMQSYCGSTIIAEIVQAFIERREVDYSVAQTGNIVTTLSAKADFSTVAEDAEFICYCSGHTHLDIVNFLRDYPKQLELNIGCNNVHYTSGTDMLQEEGEKSQNLINVYNIDRNRGYVYIVRIGADFSNTAQDRSFTAIKYRNDE